MPRLKPVVLISLLICLVTIAGVWYLVRIYGLPMWLYPDESFVTADGERQYAKWYHRAVVRFPNLFRFRGVLRSADGTIQTIGLIEISGDNVKIVRATFFDPDGTEVSRVINGNGIAVFFRENGGIAKIIQYRQSFEVWQILVNTKGEVTQ